MKIGNIISKKNISVSDYFNLYNRVSDIDNSLPVLIVGWDLVENLYPHHDITENRVNNNIFWCVNKTVNRDSYEECVVMFEKHCFKEIIKDVKYIYVDPILSSNQRLLKIVRKIYSLKNVISYDNGDMVYMYSDNFIFGIDIKILKYIGFNTEKILSKIKLISKVFLVDNEIIIEYKKNAQSLDNGIKYIPYFFSIQNG